MKKSELSFGDTVLTSYLSLIQGRVNGVSLSNKERESLNQELFSIENVKKCLRVPIGFEYRDIDCLCSSLEEVFTNTKYKDKEELKSNIKMAIELLTAVYCNLQDSTSPEKHARMCKCTQFLSRVCTVSGGSMVTWIPRKLLPDNICVSFEDNAIHTSCFPNVEYDLESLKNTYSSLVPEGIGVLSRLLYESGGSFRCKTYKLLSDDGSGDVYDQLLDANMGSKVLWNLTLENTDEMVSAIESLNGNGFKAHTNGYVFRAGKPSGWAYVKDDIVYVV